ncbi:hypothetical protein DF182_12780 [Chitinophaga flava]|uniref:Uncharacterized protein n=1 Tax=Chitinophaga flava TaxID=2259036 RepID=A0A365Y468_9BACT|nr:hypothetical protein DF182_12780 [Chitinophaga flava]
MPTRLNALNTAICGLLQDFQGVEAIPPYEKKKDGLSGALLSESIVTKRVCKVVTFLGHCNITAGYFLIIKRIDHATAGTA